MPKFFRYLNERDWVWRQGLCLIVVLFGMAAVESPGVPTIAGAAVAVFLLMRSYRRWAATGDESEDDSSRREPDEEEPR